MSAIPTQHTAVIKTVKLQKYDSIQRLKKDDGSWGETKEEVQQIIVEYFENMFTSNRPHPDDIQRGVEHLSAVVDEAMATELQRPFTEEEYVLNFLNDHIMPTGFNETNIVFIPKIKRPESLAHFRPISLCNVVYKIASKSIANRLKPWLDEIISLAQSAFVPGRLISDNVLLAFELNHFLHTHSKGRKQFLNLKLDISKAYDRVEWCFLEKVLGKLGFPPSFIDLIMLCITSVSYSFVLSGSRFGSILPQRGLRQGDPLSPYLFLLCTESFSSLFRHAEANRVVPGVPICRGAPAISHLLFAYDTMIFCPASQDIVQHVQEILASYKQASEQQINLQKSSVAFIRNTPLEVQRHLGEVLGIRLENKHEKYLGLPSMAFRSKRALFAPLKDRIWKRIHSWHEKTLSQADKAILIQSVVQAFPSFAMSYFRLPKTLLKEFQSLAADFFWHNGDRRPKQFWRILSRSDCLVSRVLKAKYFPHNHIFEAQVGNQPSYTWRSIIAARELLKSGCRWRIGTRHSVDVWNDPWIPRPASFRIITPNVHNVQNMCVSNLISPITREWDVDTINALLWPVDRKLFFRFPLASREARTYLFGITLTMVFSRFVVRIIWHCHLLLHLPQVRAMGDRVTRSFRILSGKRKFRTKPRVPSLGLNVVARNSFGVCLAWCSVRYERRGPAFLAETLAAREAIRSKIEGDCASLLSKISRASQDRSVFGPLIFDIVSFAAQLETVSILCLFGRATLLQIP
ncbi:putative mitochondrial protein [Sesamum angolense]|uniref:Mitochondrial protein n=1 Tax=Sesamum angolense TaxID=2727404 RepID=A0AAE1X3J4_9LAMI|nr:putative mitochondrial protein [Sesamum angolense]